MLGQEPRRDHVIYFSQQLPQVGGAILFHSFTCEGTEALRDEPPAWGHTARGSQGPPGLCSLYCLYPNALLLGTPLLPDAIAQLWLAVGSRGGGVYSSVAACAQPGSPFLRTLSVQRSWGESQPLELSPATPSPKGSAQAMGHPGRRQCLHKTPGLFSSWSPWSQGPGSV